MKNKIIATLLTVTFASVVSAQVLYWQVNPNVEIVNSTEGTSWNYATIYAVKSDSTVAASQLTSYTKSSASWNESTYVDSNYFKSSTPAYADLSSIDYSGYSFYIELVNVTNAGTDNQTITGVARSDSVSYDKLGTALQSAAEFNASWSSINAIGSGLTFTAIPEPTSGLMLLVGAAILSLRRKRQQI